MLRSEGTEAECADGLGAGWEVFAVASVFFSLQLGREEPFYDNLWMIWLSKLNLVDLWRRMKLGAFWCRRTSPGGSSFKSEASPECRDAATAPGEVKNYFGQCSKHMRRHLLVDEKSEIIYRYR